MATTVSIPGGGGNPPLIFKITGTSAGNYGTAFQNAVAGSNVVVLSNPGVVPVAGANILNEILTDYRTPTSVVGTPYDLAFGGQHTAVDVGVSTTVTGSAAGGDTVLATGVVTYDAVGSGNNVDFIDGSNTYNGSSVAGATGDTITGGSGFDTINTGAGFSTVFSGSGHTLINLNDTVGSGTTPGGVVYLGDGTATVNAGGYDDIVTGTNGQTINGSSLASSTLNVVIGDNATSSGAAGDLINAGAGTTTVFDSVGGNSIFGGSGTLNFIGESPASGVVSDTIVAGTGPTNIFGADGDAITLGGGTSNTFETFSAGLGNETLNAANADGSVTFFGYSDTAGSATANDSSSSATFVGSTLGNNYFQTGSGAEALVGGTGNNVFGITDGGTTAHVTIFDFAAGNDSVNFLGETAAQVNADLSNATTSTASNGQSELTVTLSDNSTVTFVGITSLTGHVVGHTGG